MGAEGEAGDLDVELAQGDIVQPGGGVRHVHLPFLVVRRGECWEGAARADGPRGTDFYKPPISRYLISR
ncbi:hypothetical protein D3C78_1909620 [compost metagenome]